MHDDVPPDTERAPRLVEVAFETILGARYVFPDMNAEMFKAVCLDRIEHLRDVNLTLVNVSQACLVMPVRIIKKILVNGEERWTRPSTT